MGEAALGISFGYALLNDHFYEKFHVCRNLLRAGVQGLIAKIL
jgi:hypothetical protein